MSEQKKRKLASADSRLNDVILESPLKRKPAEQMVVETRHSQSAAKEDPSDWREKALTVKEIHLTTFEKSILTDITLEVGSEKTPFQAHKLILAFGSPIFQAMFYGPLAEKGEKIIIPNIKSSACKVLLRHLYGDNIKLETDREAVDVWVAAKKYLVKHLLDNCEKYFRTCHISSSNIWFLTEASGSLFLVPLIFRCKKYLEIHMESSVCSEEFLDTKFGTVKEMLVMSPASVSELVLLQRVIDWGMHQFNAGKDASPTVLLKSLLPYIHFGALTPPEFCIFLTKVRLLPDIAGLLENGDALAILQHLIQPLTYPLPDWCRKKNQRRQPSVAECCNVRLNEFLP